MAKGGGRQTEAESRCALSRFKATVSRRPVIGTAPPPKTPAPAATWPPWGRPELPKARFNPLTAHAPSGRVKRRRDSLSWPHVVRSNLATKMGPSVRSYRLNRSQLPCWAVSTDTVLARTGGGGGGGRQAEVESRCALSRFKATVSRREDTGGTAPPPETPAPAARWPRWGRPGSCQTGATYLLTLRAGWTSRAPPRSSLLTLPRAGARERSSLPWGGG